MRILGIVALGATLTGCVTAGETVQFRASNPQQQAMMRDGQPALVSRQKSSVVLVRPASRQLQANGRPVFIVGINNLSRGPIDFRVAQVEVSQKVGASEYPMQVITYEMLAQEEKNRQIASAISSVSRVLQMHTAPRRRDTATIAPRLLGLAAIIKLPAHFTARQPQRLHKTTRLSKMKRCSR